MQSCEAENQKGCQNWHSTFMEMLAASGYTGAMLLWRNWPKNLFSARISLSRVTKACFQGRTASPGPGVIILADSPSHCLSSGWYMCVVYMAPRINFSSLLCLLVGS